MKPSPLLLKVVTYPSASYELIDDYDGSLDAITPVVIETASVNYSLDGEHMALLRLKSDHAGRSVPYRFDITAVAVFQLDVQLAKQEYKPRYPEGLPHIVAVNVARVLYGGAREHIAVMTARGTYGQTVLESQLIEPSDVEIGSDASRDAILQKVFQLSEEELSEMHARVEAYRGASRASGGGKSSLGRRTATKK